MTHNVILASALGRENPQEANVDKEKQVIDVVKDMNFAKLRKALETGDKDDWKKAVDTIGYDKLSKDAQEKIDKIITDIKNKDILAKFTAYIAGQDTFMGLDPQAKESMTLQQASDFLVNKKNELIVAQNEGEKNAPVTVVPPIDIYTLSDGHSSLYLLARLMTKGYIPQLSDNMWAKTPDQSWLKNIWSKMQYVLVDGGPFTNNKDSKNPVVGAWHTKLMDKVAAFSLIHVADEKTMLADSMAGMKAKNFDGKVALEAELLDRKAKVDAIEAVLKKAPLDEKALKDALGAYENSVKTKWEAIFHKIGTKIGANGWNIFKTVDAGVYVSKANNILIAEKSLRDFGPISESVFHGMYDALKAGKVEQMIFQTGEDGKWYQVIERNAGGTYKIQEVKVENEKVT